MLVDLAGVDVGDFARTATRPPALTLADEDTRAAHGDLSPIATHDAPDAAGTGALGRACASGTPVMAPTRRINNLATPAMEQGGGILLRTTRRIAPGVWCRRYGLRDPADVRG